MRDGWLSHKIWVAKLVARFESRHLSRKYKIGDISKGVANTLLPAQKIYQKIFLAIPEIIRRHLHQ
jgi:hypothetical protein